MINIFALFLLQKTLRIFYGKIKKRYKINFMSNYPTKIYCLIAI